MTEFLRNWFSSVFDYGVFNKVSDILKLNPSTGEYASGWNAVNVVYNNVMVPIALGLMIIWFLVSFMDKSASEQMSFEQLLMLFVKLIAAKFLIDHGLEIFTSLWSLGISLIDQVGDSFANGQGITFNVHEQWHKFAGINCGNISVPLNQCSKNLGLIQSLGAMCQLLIPWVVSLAMTACVYFICYSRLIEMYVRMLAAPIAVSDFITEGLHGSGWRYLKNFLAICLQGMIIVAISQLYPLIMSGVLTTSGGFWSVVLKFIAFSFSAIALMFKSLSLAKELVGTA